MFVVLVALFVGEVLGDLGARSGERQLAGGTGAREQLAVPAEVLAGNEESVLDPFAAARDSWDPHRAGIGGVPFREHCVRASAPGDRSHGKQPFARCLQGVDGDAFRREQLGGEQQAWRGVPLGELEVLGALAAPGQLFECRAVGLCGALGGLLMVAVDRYRKDAGRFARAPCFDEEVGSWPGAQGRSWTGTGEARQEYGFRVQGGDHVVRETVAHGALRDGKSEGPPQLTCLHASVGEFRTLPLVGEGQMAAGVNGQGLAVLQPLPVFGQSSASSLTGEGGRPGEDAEQCPGRGDEILSVGAS
ncbi:hypothetical protein ACFV5G_36210 [Streptomyces sp. NPDC059766]|uniref:hypothetical protein n=1 Tax=Streptomyces sp. NPDC059766 TaxID=3346940 RepID=UPI003649921F